MTRHWHDDDLAWCPCDEDSEEFCPDCFAGMESSEHHEKCVAPLDAD